MTLNTHNAHLLLAVVLVLLALVACAPSSETPAPISTGAAAEQSPAPADSDNEVTAGPIPEITEAGPGAFDLADPLVGLAGFSSYRAALAVSFEGTRDGQPEQWSETYVMLVSDQPAARQVTVERTGQPAAEGEFPRLMIEMDGLRYGREGGSGICSASISAGASELARNWEPASALLGVFGAEEAGMETVNDVPAMHYAFDQRALVLMDHTQSSGEVWVAEDGGYVVRYTLTIAGGPDYFGEGIEGMMTLSYDLHEVNQPVTITVPADCPPALVNAPLMPDAANARQMPGLTTYDLPSASLEDVLAFYQAELPALGWEMSGDLYITDTTAALDFIQGDRRLSVVAAAGDVTTVQLALSPTP